MTENRVDERLHHRACNLCEAICGLEIRTAGDEILSIRADPDDPLSQGHICPKAVALKDLHADPDRLRRPVRRTATGWEELGWDEAFDLVADRLCTIIERDGPDAVASYLGNPTVHNHGSITHGPRFLGSFRSKNRYSATSVDQLPHQLVAYWMYGHQLLVPVPDLDRCDYLLVFGANPMASNGSLMTAPAFPKRLKRLRERGGRMVVLDPRRSETAAVADEHLFIRPGTDAAFLAAMLKIIDCENLGELGRLAGCTDGFDHAMDAIGELDPHQLAAHCGIPLATIMRIAREFAEADAACAYGRMGVSTQVHGTLCQWLIQLLNIATGNLDHPGGPMFTRPAVDLIDSPASRPGSFGRWFSRLRGLPEFGGELPVATLADEILTPGTGQIRALVTLAGNPVLSTPNGQRLDTALAQLEFMAAIDFYVNETTRHADVILPPTCTLEHDHYDLIFHSFAVRNTARFSDAVFERRPDQRHDWEILDALGDRIAARLGTKREPHPRPDQIIDLGLKTGPYGVLRKAPQALSLSHLRAAPHGVDLGPLEPCLPGRLRTADRHIRCAIPEMFAALETLERAIAEPASAGSLTLIGRRHVRSNNSWLHNAQRLVKGPARHRLLMHPADLAARGLVDGARVRVQSRVGRVEVEVEASDAMMPGVVSLPHGWGHDRAGVRLSVAVQQPGVSCNDLTDECAIDAVCGNAALNGVPVSVQPA